MGKSHAALAAGDSAVAHRGSIAYVLAMKLSKMLLVVLALLVSFRLAGLAETQQPMPASVATGFNLIREDTLRADLTFLASDALEGRMSLQNGDAVAIQWIASEFAKAGLQPAENGSVLQPVQLIEYRADRAQSYVALKRSGSERSEEHTSELQSLTNLVCRLLLEKKKKKKQTDSTSIKK